MKALLDVRQHPGTAIGALVGGIVFGVIVGIALGLDGGDERSPDETVTTAPPATPVVSGVVEEQNAVRSALQEGIAAAEQPTGYSRAAVWADGWPNPIVEGTSVEQPVGMRTLSAAPTVLAVLARDTGGDKALRQAIDDSLSRSESCRLQRVLLGIVESSKSPEKASRAFRNVLKQAGVEPGGTAGTVRPPERECGHYLNGAGGAGIRDSAAKVPQFPDWKWTVKDGVGFAYALADGDFGGEGEELLSLVSAPKGRNRESFRPARGIPPDWGAGKAFGDLNAAYWSGWGGSADGDFLVAQVGVVRSDDRFVAFAVMYEPRKQPREDDLGDSSASAALAEVLSPVARLIRTGGIQ